MAARLERHATLCGAEGLYLSFDAARLLALGGFTRRHRRLRLAQRVALHLGEPLVQESEVRAEPLRLNVRRYSVGIA